MSKGDIDVSIHKKLHTPAVNKWVISEHRGPGDHREAENSYGNGKKKPTKFTLKNPSKKCISFPIA